MCPNYAELRRECWDDEIPANIEQGLGDRALVKGTSRFLLGTGRLPYLLPPPPIEDPDTAVDY